MSDEREPADGVTLASWVYTKLLKALPSDVSGPFGPQMIELFERMRRSAHERRIVAAWRYTLQAWSDLVFTGVIERLRRGFSGDAQGEAAAVRARRRLRGGEVPMLGNLISDSRLAVRTLAKAPAFTAILVLTFALGIGANTAIFSVLNSVLFQPLPYGEPDELVLVWHRAMNEDGQRAGVGGADLQDYIDQSRRFVAFAGAQASGTNLTGEGPAERVVLSWVTPEFFRVLGVDAMLGRTLAPADQVTFDRDVITDPSYTPPPVAVVLSHGLWERLFGRDPSVVGQLVEINGQRMSVLGVMPAEFRLYLGADALMPTDVDAWTFFPLALTSLGRGSSGITVLARLAAGVSIQEGQDELNAIAQRLREDFQVHARRGTEVELAGLHEEVVGPVRSYLWVLFGAVGIVLLIACANVANLLLVRAGIREQEFAIRRALGGGRGRIYRQLLTESLLVGLLGSAVGLLLARWGISLLLALEPANLPRVDGVGIDGAVLTFTVVTSMAAALLFGLAPASRLSRSRLNPSRTSRGDSTGGRAQFRLRSALIITEVALSVVLLVGAGLLLRSFLLLRDVEPGFDARGVVAADIALPFFEYRANDARRVFYEELIDVVGDIPGVSSAGGITPMPLAGGGGAWVSPYALEEVDAAEWTRRRTDYRLALPGYFATVDTEVLMGRPFEGSDLRADALPVIVVDETFRDLIWPDRSPLGERLLISAPAENEAAGRVWAEVVGMVENSRHNDLTRDGRGTIYVPYSVNPWFEVSLLVKTEGDIASVAAAIRERVLGLNPSIPVFDVVEMQSYVDGALAPTRFALMLIGVFALVALTLASIGLYGVLSTSVQQRTREIGVRMAIGAERDGIVCLIVRQGMTLVAVGIGLGLLGAALVSRVMSGLLFGVLPVDPLTFGVTPIILAAVALVACYLPARRATRVDPLVALRME